jgi:site-specific DNA-methyltransferase (adenine-specific)
MTETSSEPLLLLGDCLDRLREMSDNSVDSVVTDPPYGLSFMRKKWDYDVPSEEIWRECLRVLKPGGHLLAFAGTRTQHRMAVRIEDAGFEIRDMIAWVYGSGFPKSLDVSKAIDKSAGADREVVGQKVRGDVEKAKASGSTYAAADANKNNKAIFGYGVENITAPATEAARQWQGWGTALKPALEPITVARKPLGEKTVAANVLAHGTGAINVDGCRVGVEGGTAKANIRKGETNGERAGTSMGENISYRCDIAKLDAGRWPANLIHDGSDEVVGLFPERNGGAFPATQNTTSWKMSSKWKGLSPARAMADSGSAARFFYCAKASKKDRNEGLDSSRTVKHATGLCKEENMALVGSLQKATCESTVRWGIDESGGSITGQCPLASLSTTLTAISKITTSEIFNSWTPSPTSESTAGVKSSTANGGSHAENAEKSKESQQTTTSENQAESAHGASNVVSKMLSSISDVENWKPATNFHATVKPTALMRYLCRLVTPPGCIVLDPFMGSGSTGKAAMLEGFQFIGIERDEEYMEIAKARIGAASNEHT